MDNFDDDARKFAPSAGRNREPIFEVLRPLLPDRGLVLEIASGSGEHITGLADGSRSDLVFQPSDPDVEARRSVDAWTRELGRPNVRPALELDAASDWPIERADLVFCINMIHISPWQATEGLFRGAARVLPAGGVLFTYGPYRRGGVHTSPGNESFDQDLQRRNPAWGIRDVEAVTELAKAHGLAEPEIVEMPANNLSLVFRRD
ncbi:MAG: DUF938 domain-containing protein [Hyphomicrobiaceae bacterium]